MAIYRLQKATEQSDILLPEISEEEQKRLQSQLELELAECVRANSTGRNHLKRFMIQNGIWHIAELDYEARVAFDAWLGESYKSGPRTTYVKAFDRVKQYAVQKSLGVAEAGKRIRPRYRNERFFLPYYPDGEIAEYFNYSTKKEDLVWDFSIDAPETMKRQMLDVLCAALEEATTVKNLQWRLYTLRSFYGYCCRRKIQNIELMELYEVEQYYEEQKKKDEYLSVRGVIDYCQRQLFLQADTIHWEAHVWYVDRFHLHPERIDPANPVKSISFTEVVNPKNRELLKEYARYTIGITGLSIGNIRSELTIVRRFLTDLKQPEQKNILGISSAEMDAYFRAEQKRDVNPETFNKCVLSVLHFFQYLLVKHYVEKIPFDHEHYLKKTIPYHYNRSVNTDITDEIMGKLYLFPEELRLMYFHLWGTGLRISEVCTLHGDAYYIQANDTWVQVYQTKMRGYKRIPIPLALYDLMMVYLQRHNIGANDYVFQNSRGGAYRSGTFRWRMKRLCEEHQIKNGEYLFQSHDYRHTLATFFYNNGVSLQGVRDYLGHMYEEMTLQYVDYMQEKIQKKNEEYFSNNNLAAELVKGIKKDG